MKREYDFPKGKRGALLSAKGKTRITIFIDDTVLAEFRSRAEKVGTGYQTMVNEALKNYLSTRTEPPVTESLLRQVIREEVPKLSRPTSRSSDSGTKHRVV